MSVLLPKNPHRLSFFYLFKELNKIAWILLLSAFGFSLSPQCQSADVHYRHFLKSVNNFFKIFLFFCDGKFSIPKQNAYKCEIVHILEFFENKKCAQGNKSESNGIVPFEFFPQVQH